MAPNVVSINMVVHSAIYLKLLQVWVRLKILLMLNGLKERQGVIRDDDNNDVPRQGSVEEHGEGREDRHDRVKKVTEVCYW